MEWAIGTCERKMALCDDINSIREKHVEMVYWTDFRCKTKPSHCC